VQIARHFTALVVLHLQKPRRKRMNRRLGFLQCLRLLNQFRHFRSDDPDGRVGSILQRQERKPDCPRIFALAAVDHHLAFRATLRTPMECLF